MKTLTVNQKERDEIVFGEKQPEYMGGVARFNGLTAEKLQELIDRNFADPEETQNSSPTIEEFLEFLKEFPQFTAHGYVVTADRSDYRVSIEGVEAEKRPNRKAMDHFISMFRHADDFELDPPYAWYD